MRIPTKVVFVRTLALCWIVFLSGFFIGIFVYYTKVWPYDLIKEIKAFLEGSEAEQLSITEKLENDFDIKPVRHLQEYLPKENLESGKFKDLNGLDLNSRRMKPKIFISENAPAGYRVIHGAFDFKKGLSGVILLDLKGEVVHVWYISQEGLEWEHEKDLNAYPHGFEIAPDGSIVTAYDNGTSLTKYDYDSNVIWRIKGGYNHSIAFEGDDAIWCLGESGTLTRYGTNLVKINYHTGEVINEIPLQKVMDANLDIDIFGIRQTDKKEGSVWQPDRWHPNDIDPLPQKIEQYYPNFSAGDLLLSLRSVDLVFVMDPMTLKIKWWRQGLTRRQHDPDWNDKGTITIFNNNMHRGYSTIVEINPNTYESKIIIDGRNYDFYTWYRGKQELLPNGGVLITSSAQGRVFETDKEGNITFEFYNLYEKNDKFLTVSEARFLPSDFFKEIP